MRTPVPGRLLALTVPLTVAGCSFLTDFDDFETGDPAACDGVEVGACEVAVPLSDGSCDVRLATTGTACTAEAGGCFVGSGTCDDAGVCVGAPAGDGTPCAGDFGVCNEAVCDGAGACVGRPLGMGAACEGGFDQCARGACDGAGTCVEEPAEAGLACDAGGAACVTPVCDGAGGCGAPFLEPNDTCANAAPLFEDPGPGPKPPVTAQCLTHTVDGLCGPTGAPDAFFAADIPVPRWLRVDVRRPDGEPLGVPGALTFANDCSPGERFDCVTLAEAPFDRPLIPGDYRVLVDVGAEGGELPPAFEVRTLVDPQNRCATTPELVVPDRGAEPLFFDASNLGATDDYDWNGLGGRDHVYEIVVETPGRVLFETFPVPDDELFPEERNIGDSVLVLLDDCVNSRDAILASDDDGGVDAYSQLSVDLDAGRYFLVVDGYEEENQGTYQLSIRTPEGHLVLIGHDYFQPNESAMLPTSTNADRVLANAVGLSPMNDVRVGAYAARADVTDEGEANNADTAIEDGLSAQGRSAVIERFVEDDLETLADVSAASDVLVVYEQELGLPEGSNRVRAALSRFVSRGGVAVVMDAFGQTAPLADGPGLLDTGWETGEFAAPYSPATDLRMTVADRTDPVAAGVSTTYTGPNASSAYTELRGGNTVIEADVEVFDPRTGTFITVTAPVVVHRTYR